eukprot:TRINITY_DN31749_c0_g1_i1.p1 TRINITY_DN31749_c0_g1~~TRINITY_DN31749_c0_g1_i1.p1  ORF type:complete len:570 (+),score=132.88 TRINITY_DN31749_c0_g1_i1:98-1711(+)
MAAAAARRCRSLLRRAQRRASSTPAAAGNSEAAESAGLGLLNKTHFDQCRRRCPRRAWHARRGLWQTDVHMFSIEQGRAFETDYFETLHAGHQNAVRNGGLQESSVRVAEQLREAAPGAVLREAALVAGQMGARADGLRRLPSGDWEVIEVKSCTDTNADRYVWDLAFTTHVAIRAGLNVEKATLVAVNSNWRLGDPERERFVEKDCTSEVLTSWEPELQELVPEVMRITAAAEPPPAAPVGSCKGCTLAASCWPSVRGPPLWELPKMLGPRLKALAAEQQGRLGIADLSPEQAKLLTSHQQRTWRAVTQDALLVNNYALLESLAAGAVWPRWYLDFETFALLCPIFPGVAPHEPVVVQYSVHRQDSPGGDLTHFEFVATPGEDCREELAKSLVEALRGTGPVVVYTGYEDRQLKALANHLVSGSPLSEELRKVQRRLFDLEEVVRKHGEIDHPLMCGSTSLKRVAPALVPALRGSYEEGGVTDGQQAATMYADMVLGKVPAEEHAGMLRLLLDYCALDTRALAMLHARLEEIALSD